MTSRAMMKNGAGNGKMPHTAITGQILTPVTFVVVARTMAVLSLSHATVANGTHSPPSPIMMLVTTMTSGHLDAIAAIDIPSQLAMMMATHMQTISHCLLVNPVEATHTVGSITAETGSQTM